MLSLLISSQLPARLLFSNKFAHHFISSLVHITNEVDGQIEWFLLQHFARLSFDVLFIFVSIFVIEESLFIDHSPMIVVESVENEIMKRVRVL